MSIPKKELIERERLHLLQQFVLNRESEEIREELYEYMIMSVIFRHASDDGKIETSIIHKLVKSDFHLDKMPDMQLKDGISRLLAKQSIHEAGNYVSLSKNKLLKFKNTSTGILDLEKNSIEELRSKISDTFPDDFQEKIEPLLQRFDEFVSLIFKKFGIQAAQIFAENVKSIDDLDGFTNFTDLYQKHILITLPEEQQKQLDRILYDFFSNPTEKSSKYFFSIAQSYVLTQILNIEPNLKKIQSDLLSKKQVYLDTNVIIRLLFHNDTSSKAIKKLIDETRKLKIKLIMTDLTSTEFERWLDKKENKFRYYKLPSKKLEQALGEYDPEDEPFFLDFTQELMNDSSLTAKKFAKKYHQFEILLKNQYGIVTENIIKSIIHSSEIKQLKNEVINSKSKHEEVALHDAYHIIRVRQLRQSKKTDELGPNSWFLTTDSTLSKAEFEQYPTKDVQASVTVNSWFQIISTFISPVGNIEDVSFAFCKLLSSQFDSHKMKVNDYLNFVDALTNDAEFTLDQLKNITGNTFITQKLRTINQKRESGETPSKSEISTAVAEMQKFSKGSFDDEVEKIRIESEQKIKAEVEKANDATKKANDAETSKSKIKTKSILIIIALATVILNILMDITVFKDAFLIADSTMVAVLGLNIAITMGIPKLIHFFYKAE